MENKPLIYLDNSSTTRQYDQVTDFVCQLMREDFGNPSSLHRLGINAEKKIKEARERLSKSSGYAPEEIIFTSGGTESDNSAIFSAAEAMKRRGKHIITTQVEHPAVLEPMRKLEKMGFEVTYLPVDEFCRVSVDDYKNALRDDTIFTSIMTVNNEVGTIMDIPAMYKLKGQGLFHTDAVQAFGKVDIPKVDMVSVSSHKIHGPKGTGALFVKKGLNFKPFMIGGGQEKGLRSGTENVPAIAGFGLAAEMTKVANSENIRQVRNYLREGILSELKDVFVNSPDDGVATVLNLSFVGTRSEVILHTLEQDGIFVSSGSACSSNKKGGSHVLTAMGLGHKRIDSAIRFSLSSYNTIEDMDYTIDKVKNAVTRFRKLGSFR